MPGNILEALGFESVGNTKGMSYLHLETDTGKQLKVITLNIPEINQTSILLKPLDAEYINDADIIEMLEYLNENS
jgi:hypothetical protein